METVIMQKAAALAVLATLGVINLMMFVETL
jgi:hypothetical protein